MHTNPFTTSYLEKCYRVGYKPFWAIKIDIDTDPVAI